MDTARWQMFTWVSVVDHEEVAVLHLAISSQLELEHARVELHVAPLDVDGRLLSATTRRILIWPVDLIQRSLCETDSFITTHSYLQQCVMCSWGMLKPVSSTGMCSQCFVILIASISLVGVP